MEYRQVLLVLAVVAVIAGSHGAPSTGANDIPKPSYARTMLKVSRSLSNETRELKVNTSDGNIATLIVKRREKSLPEKLAPSINESINKSTASPTPIPSTTDNIPSTIGYQNVEVDPWIRLQTWSSVSGSKVEKLEAEKQKEKEEEESRSWRPVNSEGLDSWKPVLVSDSGRSFQTIPADSGSRDTLLRYTSLPHEPRRTVRTNVGVKNRDAKNVPAEVVIRSEINVKPLPGQAGQQQVQQRPVQEARRSSMTIDTDGIPVVHGRRVPDDPMDKIQVWRNARVINDQLVTDSQLTASSTTARGLPDFAGTTSFERFFEDVNRRYVKLSDDANQKSRPYRNEVLAAEIYESAEDEPTYRPSIRKRMLQSDLGSPNYPNSRLYSPPEPPTGAPSVKPGTRAPVLQYAHPELGVQPAKAAAPTRSEKTARRHEETQSSITEAPMLQQYVPPASGARPGEHRHKKKYVLNDKNLLDSYNKNYYPYQHFYGLRRPVVEPPFWVKISENIKNQFSDGVAKVSEYTKPVFDPLVEATRKISENLGLSRTQDHAQDKIGSVATGTSVLIPALGLMASGAALGIGAVAVGRYLDVDVLKRSNGAAQLQMASEDADDERAFSAISQMDEIQTAPSQPHEDIYVLVQEDNPEITSRSKRSSSNFDSRQMQRKGADPIAEIVEIDVPSKSLDDTTADEGNDVQLEDEEKLAETIVQRALEAIASKTKKNNKASISLTMDKTSETRRKRSLNVDDKLDDALQNLESAELAEVNEANGHIAGDWTNTPCAKRIFCEAMVKRGSDIYMFMDKKMYGLLRMIQPTAAVQVSAHFDEVMEAVRRHDCSIFVCSRPRMPRHSSAPAA